MYINTYVKILAILKTFVATKIYFATYMIHLAQTDQCVNYDYPNICTTIEYTLYSFYFFYINLKMSMLKILLRCGISSGDLPFDELFFKKSVPQIFYIRRQTPAAYHRHIINYNQLHGRWNIMHVAGQSFVRTFAINQTLLSKEMQKMYKMEYAQQSLKRFKYFQLLASTSRYYPPTWQVLDCPVSLSAIKSGYE